MSITQKQYILHTHSFSSRSSAVPSWRERRNNRENINRKIKSNRLHSASIYNYMVASTNPPFLEFGKETDYQTSCTTCNTRKTCSIDQQTGLQIKRKLCGVLSSQGSGDFFSLRNGGQKEYSLSTAFIYASVMTQTYPLIKRSLK